MGSGVRAQAGPGFSGWFQRTRDLALVPAALASDALLHSATIRFGWPIVLPLSDARWKTIAESQYPWEREALARERLPDPGLAWSSFEFPAAGKVLKKPDSW